MADYVKPWNSIFKLGLVNITEVVTRLYGPGITDPPSLDLVEGILAVEQYWYTGMSSLNALDGRESMTHNIPALPCT